MSMSAEVAAALRDEISATCSPESMRVYADMLEEAGKGEEADAWREIADEGYRPTDYRGRWWWLLWLDRPPRVPRAAFELPESIFGSLPRLEHSSKLAAYDALVVAIMKSGPDATWLARGNYTGTENGPDRRTTSGYSSPRI